MPTTEVSKAVWEFQKRPCIVTVERTVERPRIGGKFRGTYVQVQVRFLDGQQPPFGQFGKVTWGQRAKRLAGAQGLVWGRVRELVDEGLGTGEARTQAMAELNKGVLNPHGAF